MKRRNIDSAKMRRTLKKNRMSEGFCSSGLIYLKILFVWAFVMMADFLLDFRFEYFWPSWLLLRSIYDSFRYQGVAFSVFFVCVTVTSDMICFIFIPVQWLFFLAGTCVWVQYVWHADRGICLPTVTLWLLFIYVEASVRLKELKTLPFTLDLCRPFAAHCIGYPVVTLGFGVKTYVSYRLRWRKQREVAKENEVYAQLLREALPVEQQHRVTDGSSELDQQKYITSGLTSEDVISSDLTRCPSVSSALYNASASYMTSVGSAAVASSCTSPFFANFFGSSSLSSSNSGQQQQHNLQTGLNNTNSNNNTLLSGSQSSRLTKNSHFNNANNFTTASNNVNQYVNNGFTADSSCHNSSALNYYGKNATNNGGPSFISATNLHSTTAYQRANSGTCVKSTNENGSVVLSHRKRSNSLVCRQQSDQSSYGGTAAVIGGTADTGDNRSGVVPLISWLYSLFCKMTGVGRWSNSKATTLPNDSYNRTGYDYFHPSSYLPSLSWSSYDSVLDANGARSLSHTAANGILGDDSDDESRVSKDSSESALAPAASSPPPLRSSGGVASQHQQRKTQALTSKHRKRSGTASNIASTTNAAANLTPAVGSGSSPTSALITKDVNTFSAPQHKVQEKDLYAHLESDLEKMRNELRQGKGREQELKRQVNELTNSDKTSRNELQQIKQQHEQLQTKFQNLMKARQQDKENVSTLEKRVCEEQKLKNQLEQQLKQEKKQQQKKLEEAVNLATGKSANVNSVGVKNECTEICKQRRRELENQLKLVRRDLQQREEQMTQLEQELAALRQYKESNNVEVMMSALNALQEKNQHLELSLSAETRIKLDLFSALGDAKRQLEITTAQKKAKEQELEEIKHRFNQITNANNALLFNGQSVSNSQQQQQLTPPSSVTPVVNLDHQPNFDVLSQQLYTSPYNMNSMNGLMFDDCGMTYHHSGISFVPLNSGNVGGNNSSPDQQVSTNLRYSPPRSSAAK